MRDLLIFLFILVSVTVNTGCVTNSVRYRQEQYTLKGLENPCTDGRMYAYGESCF